MSVKVRVLDNQTGEVLVDATVENKIDFIGARLSASGSPTAVASSEWFEAGESVVTTLLLPDTERGTRNIGVVVDELVVFANVSDQPVILELDCQNTAKAASISEQEYENAAVSKLLGKKVLAWRITIKFADRPADSETAS